MALSGNQKAYLQARSGIARSGASRSNYVFPLYGTIVVEGLDLTAHVLYGSLRVSLELNDQPDTASFDVMLTDGYVDAALTIGQDVLIGLAGGDPLFGGKILTAQTVCGPARGPHKRSIMCADYLQVLDSEYLITYGWPAQSATATILDLVARFANRASGIAISTAGVQTGLPNHAAFTVANERFSTVLRRLVTMFPTGGGFYVDPLKVLHVWQGASEPFVTHPAMVTIDSPQLKALSETVDNAQQRDAVVVEGARTTAPIGTEWDPATDPAFLLSVPVTDASILDKISYTETPREVRIGTQRLMVRYAEGPWSVAAGAPSTTTVATDVGWPPSAGINHITVASTAFVQGRQMPWVKIDEQYLKVIAYSGAGVTPAFLQVSGTGWGALLSDVKAGAVVTAIDAIGDIHTTSRYDVPGNLERIRPQPIDAEVVMTVRTALASDSVHEQLVQDGRFSRAGATARGQQEVNDFKAALITVQFETVDLNAKPGRIQAYQIADPVVSLLQGEYMILTADLSWPVWGELPRRVCTAAEVRAASVLDSWLVDKR